jgi:hypothetical protein
MHRVMMHMVVHVVVMMAMVVHALGLRRSAEANSGDKPDEGDCEEFLDHRNLVYRE